MTAAASPSTKRNLATLERLVVPKLAEELYNASIVMPTPELPLREVERRQARAWKAAELEVARAWRWEEIMQYRFRLPTTASMAFLGTPTGLALLMSFTAPGIAWGVPILALAGWGGWKAVGYWRDINRHNDAQFVGQRSRRVPLPNAPERPEVYRRTEGQFVYLREKNRPALYDKAEQHSISPE